MHRIETTCRAIQYVYKNPCVFNSVVHRVRLVDGRNPHTGIVEIYTNSTGGLDNAEWGIICDETWNILDAKVVCHQLGYPDAVVAPLSAHDSGGSKPIWLDSIQCLGDELDLFACEHNGIHHHSCRHDKAASAECSGIYVCIYNNDIQYTHN